LQNTQLLLFIYTSKKGIILMGPNSPIYPAAVIYYSIYGGSCMPGREKV
jgi:hypothetical protein